MRRQWEEWRIRRRFHRAYYVGDAFVCLALVLFVNARWVVLMLLCAFNIALISPEGQEVYLLPRTDEEIRRESMDAIWFRMCLYALFSALGIGVTYILYVTAGAFQRAGHILVTYPAFSILFYVQNVVFSASQTVIGVTHNWTKNPSKIAWWLGETALTNSPDSPDDPGSPGEKHLDWAELACWLCGAPVLFTVVINMLTGRLFPIPDYDSPVILAAVSLSIALSVICIIRSRRSFVPADFVDGEEASTFAQGGMQNES